MARQLPRLEMEVREGNKNIMHRVHNPNELERFTSRVRTCYINKAKNIRNKCNFDSL